jgi:tetratricopeptide (TPR) repeat protein
VAFLLLIALGILTPAQQPETLSLLEEPLYAPAVSKTDRARLERELAEARADMSRDASSADAVLRLARAQRGLGHIGDALETLTRAIEGKADTPAVRVERGRGLIAIRKFDLAQREFRKAAETLPAAYCDVAFTQYLLGDYTQARGTYGKCGDPGMFGYLAARRTGAPAGRRPAAPPDTTRTREDVSFPGSVSSKRSPDAPSIAGTYMDAVDRLIADQKDPAKDLLKSIVEKHKSMWMEPVYVAAESDYARIVKAEPKKKKKKK